MLHECLQKPSFPMDHTEAIAFLKQSDPVLAQVIDRVGDCSLGQTAQESDLLFSLCRSILHQQLSTKVAAVIHNRFLQLYASRPALSAVDILDTPDEVLRGVGLSRAKVIYIKDLAQHVLHGLPTLEELSTLDNEAIIKTLTQVKGIGRWSVQMLLIFRLHRWDVLPVDDLGIRSAIRNLYGLPDLPNKKTVEQLGRAWQPYESIASWYLWRSLENQ
jgi:DNA-3-methyladenine glycosylase II